MTEITFTDLEGSRLREATAEDAFHMDEESFRRFYERTARSLWSYVSRASGDAALADDLLQETYIRFLRAKLPSADEAYRRNYLFRIATNLLHDHWRRTRHAGAPLPELSTGDTIGEEVHRRSDLSRVLERMKPRDQQLLWLAYAEGSSHKEIAEVLGVKAPSIRLLLFRARRKFAGLLRQSGLSPS
jgi:RNA polymerase sigma-70 factor (ECF subfamily)